MTGPLVLPPKIWDSTTLLAYITLLDLTLEFPNTKADNTIHWYGARFTEHAR